MWRSDSVALDGVVEANALPFIAAHWSILSSFGAALCVAAAAKIVLLTVVVAHPLAPPAWCGLFCCCQRGYTWPRRRKERSEAERTLRELDDAASDKSPTLKHSAAGASLLSRANEWELTLLAWGAGGGGGRHHFHLRMDDVIDGETDGESAAPGQTGHGSDSPSSTKSPDTASAGKSRSKRVVGGEDSSAVGQLGSLFVLPHAEQERVIALARWSFDEFDIDCSGTIDAYELRRILHCMGQEHSREAVLDLLLRFDADASGSLDYPEFESLVLEQQSALHSALDDELRSTFEVFADPSVPGVVARGNVGTMLTCCGPALDEGELESMLNDHELNGASNAEQDIVTLSSFLRMGAKHIF